MPSLPNEEALARAVGYFEEARKEHATFVAKVDQRYSSYRGLVDEVAMKASPDWVSKAHPPYINHIVETTLASLVDDQLVYNVKPRALLLDPEEHARVTEGARAHQALHQWQTSVDEFDDIQRPFVLQNSIAGITVAKTYWITKEARRRRLVPVREPVEGPFGPLLGPDGFPVMLTRYEEHTGYETVYDGPTTEVRDIRDFLWHQAATSIDTARYLIDRVWMDFEDVEKAIDDGDFGPEAGGWNKDEILKALKETRDFSDELSNREQVLFSQDRTKDKIEICEVWDTVRDEVITFANRKVLLALKDEFPFWHEEPPFVVCSTQPDLFRVAGISQVEKVEHLQKLLWTLTNQRINNLELINNAIFWFRPDVEDPDAYEFEPGARWPVEDPSQVQMWAPNVIPAEVSLGAEALLKGDMQNLAGGFPFSSGADSQTVDQKTATGASIITSIAQRSLNLAKKEVYKAWRKVGKQRVILNTQFIREPTLVPITHGGEEMIQTIMPELLQGDYDFECKPVSDALMKQEEQASAQALLQIGLELAGPLTMFAQTGQARMIKLDKLYEDFLRASGKDDVEAYFMEKAPPMLPAAGGDPAAPGGAPSGDQPQGVTGPGSIDPAVSPSSQVSQSPMTLLQRAQALSRGGGPSH